MFQNAEPDGNHKNIFRQHSFGIEKMVKYPGQKKLNKLTQYTNNTINQLSNNNNNQHSSYNQNNQGYGYSAPHQTHYSPSYGTQPSSAAPLYNNIPPLTDLDRWFDFFDRDNNGVLDKEETVAAVAQTYGSHGKLVDIASIRESVYGMWVAFDKNNDGGINKREFMSFGGLGESLQALMGAQATSRPTSTNYSNASVSMPVSVNSNPNNLGSPQSYNPTHHQYHQHSEPQQQHQKMRVTVPNGMAPGQLIKVPTPSGTLLTVTIPPYSSWSRQPNGQSTFICRIPNTTIATPVATEISSVPIQTSSRPHTVQAESFQSWSSFRGTRSHSNVMTRSVPTSPRQFIQPSGRRKALIIGINYYGTNAALKGCINDARNMQNLLLREGYPNDSEHLLLLTDERNSGYNHQPTGANILKAFQWLLQGVNQGDMLFFHFSGHGSQVTDETGFEKDGLNETILPIDYKKGQLKDDQLWEHLVYPLPNGVRLTAVMDCCHSGTGLDLPYEYKPQKNNNFGGYNSNQFAHGIWIEDVNSAHSQGDVILFSGCEDSQTSADVSGNFLSQYQAGGAMTQSFIKAYNDNPMATFPQFMSSIHKSLKLRGFSQRPQLTSSQKFDVNSRIFSLVDGIEANENVQIGRIQRKRYKPKKSFGNGSPIDQLLGIKPSTAVGLLLGAMVLDSIF